MKQITWKSFGQAFLKLIFGIAVIVGLITWGMSCQKKHDETYPWIGSFNRGQDDQGTVVASGDFKTLDDCRAWARDKADDLDLAEGEWSFECGTNCTWAENTIASGKQIKQYRCTEIVTE